LPMSRQGRKRDLKDRFRPEAARHRKIMYKLEAKEGFTHEI
jgi:hypothetical protein